MRISDWSSDVCSSDLPLNLDGSESPMSQSSRAFARNLADLGLPVLLWDERWSTQAVTRTLIDADASRARRCVLVDKLAARDRKSTRLNSSHQCASRMPSSACKKITIISLHQIN